MFLPYQSTSPHQTYPQYKHFISHCSFSCQLSICLRRRCPLWSSWNCYSKTAAGIKYPCAYCSPVKWTLRCCFPPEAPSLAPNAGCNSSWRQLRTKHSSLQYLAAMLQPYRPVYTFCSADRHYLSLMPCDTHFGARFFPVCCFCYMEWNSSFSMLCCNNWHI